MSRAPYNFIHNSQGISLADIAKGLVDRCDLKQPVHVIADCNLLKICLC